MSRARAVLGHPEPAATEPDETARAVLDSVRARGGSLLDAIRELRGETVTDEERFRMNIEREEAARRRTLAGLRYDSWLRSGSEDRLNRIEQNLEKLTGTLAASAQMRARVAPQGRSSGENAERPVGESLAPGGQRPHNPDAGGRQAGDSQTGAEQPASYRGNAALATGPRSPARVPLTDDVLRKGLEQA